MGRGEGVDAGLPAVTKFMYNTIVMAESKEELKSLLMKVKESEKVGLKLKTLRS